jgi:MFS family permease
MVTSTTLIGDYFRAEQRDKWLGSQAALASLAAMVLFPIAGALGLLGWRGPFALYGISLVLVIGVLFFTWEPQRRAAAEEQQPAAAPRTPFPWRTMLGICFVTLLTAVMFYILQFQMGSALRTFDVDSTLTTGIFLAAASLAVPAGAIFYRFAHRWVSLPALLLGEFTLLAIGFVGMSHASSAMAFAATGFINQFGAGMLLPTLLTWGMAQLTFENRGRGTGMWQSSFSLGQFASTLVFAYAITVVGGVMPAFQVFGVMALVMAGGALLAFWRRSGVVMQQRSACDT